MLTSEPGPPRKPLGPPRSPHRDPRRALGRHGEQIATLHLERLGYTTLARNERSRHGEIDLIARHGTTLVFVEVKTRRLTRGDGHAPADVRPLDGLRPRQRARLRRLALAWLCERAEPRSAATTLRFDAIGVLLDANGRLLRLEHLEGAW